jgi:hypothetical protein
MTMAAQRNPFHELGLAVDASDADVVNRGQERIELAATDDEAQDARRAMQELTTHPRERARHELLEAPGTDYRDNAWDRFARRNRKNPVDLRALTAGAQPLRVADFDLGGVIGLLLDDLLTPPSVDIGPAVLGAPEPPAFGPPPIEVNDVIFG